ncbi:MAG: hypothetical protein WC375_05415 [Methanomassiliicoccales archaeon]
MENISPINRSRNIYARAESNMMQMQIEAARYNRPVLSAMQPFMENHFVDYMDSLRENSLNDNAIYTTENTARLMTRLGVETASPNENSQEDLLQPVSTVAPDLIIEKDIVHNPIGSIDLE